MRSDATRRAASPLVWAAGVVTLVVAAVALRRLVGTLAPSATVKEIADRWSMGGFALVLAAVAVLILVMRPGNRIGWVALGLAFFLAVNALSNSVAVEVPKGELSVALVLSRDIGFAAFISLIAWLLLLFPDGHLPSRRWRVVGWAIAAWSVLVVAASVLSPVTDQNGELVPNPTGGGPRPVGDLAAGVLPALDVMVLPLFLAAASAVIVRLVRSRGVERQQVKWFAYAAAMFPVGGIAARIVPSSVGSVAGIAVDVLLFGLPIAIAVAILRHRLYDIDLLIKRTVVYAATTAALAAVFFAGILATQTLLRPLTAGSELAIAASTLLSFAMFQPIRRLVQDAVDRRFDHSRYDAARTLDAFSARLGDDIDLDALRGNLLAAVGATMAPAQMSLWLRDRPENADGRRPALAESSSMSART